MSEIVDMVVEARDSDTAHGIPEPDLSEDNLKKQLCETILLNTDYGRYPGWLQTTLDVLTKEASKYLGPVTGKEVKTAMLEVMGYRSWKEVGDFVRDDECEDFFNFLKKWAKKIKAPLKEDLDFIDGNGIGHNKLFNERVKVTLEQAFDAKYYFKARRPLDFAIDIGLDITSSANQIHPGHYSYPAGHGTKFFTSVEVLLSVYELTAEQRKMAVLAAIVAAMARCALGIHFPQDNCAGGFLTTLDEFAV